MRHPLHTECRDWTDEIVRMQKQITALLDCIRRKTSEAGNAAVLNKERIVAFRDEGGALSFQRAPHPRRSTEAGSSSAMDQSQFQPQLAEMMLLLFRIIKCVSGATPSSRTLSMLSMTPSS